MDTELDNIKKLLSSLIISSPKGLTARDLLTDYISQIGKPVPYKNYEFHTFDAFLQSLTDVCRVHGIGPNALVVPVINEKVKHINDMIMKQKPPKRKKRKNPSAINIKPLCPSYPCRKEYSQFGAQSSKNNFLPMTNSPYRQQPISPSTMDKELENIKKILSCLIISSPKGLTARGLLSDYTSLVGKPVPFRNYRFHTFDAFLQSLPDVCKVHGIGPNALVEPVISEKIKHHNDMIKNLPATSPPFRQEPINPVMQKYNFQGFKADIKSYISKTNPPIRQEPVNPIIQRYNFQGFKAGIKSYISKPTPNQIKRNNTKDVVNKIIQKPYHEENETSSDVDSSDDEIVLSEDDYIYVSEEEFIYDSEDEKILKTTLENYKITNGEKNIEPESIKHPKNVNKNSIHENPSESEKEINSWDSDSAESKSTYNNNESEETDGQDERSSPVILDSNESKTIRIESISPLENSETAPNKTENQIIDNLDEIMKFNSLLNSYNYLKLYILSQSQTYPPEIYQILVLNLNNCDNILNAIVATKDPSVRCILNNTYLEKINIINSIIQLNKSQQNMLRQQTINSSVLTQLSLIQNVQRWLQQNGYL